VSELFGAMAVFVGIIVAWSWRFERNHQRRREEIRAWYRANVPLDETPRHLR
jgi:hypothetical protein